MRILLVDDDEVLMETLAENLIRQRYAIDIATDGETAQEFLALFTYDIIVLDMLLPDINGVAFCRQCRQQGTNTPILMLTAKDSNLDKVNALDAGADDYVVKPFDFDELCARIRALLRRDSPVLSCDLTWGQLCVKPEAFEVFYRGEQLHVTPKEYALLELLLRHPTRVFSPDAIIENLWSFDDPPSGDAVRTHIKGLRQKLKASGAPKNFIETVYGLGYRLKPIETDADTATGISTQPTPDDIKTAVALAWERHQDTTAERLRVLDAARIALSRGQISPELQQAGRSQAHKLAGMLGCFGFPEGSRIAREIEKLFQSDIPLTEQQVLHISLLIDNLRQSLERPGPTKLLDDRTGAIAHPQLLIIGADAAFLKHLTASENTIGFKPIHTQSPSDGYKCMEQSLPDGVLLWITQENRADTTALLEAIAQHPQEIFVIIIADIQDFQQRLQLVQQGVDRILSLSTPPQYQLDVVQQTLQSIQADFKVMIVDDDPHVLELIQTLLSPWGWQLTVLDDPTHLWTTLDMVQPHLLVLDVEMPSANGMEICQVLRADDQWRQLPILFLTIHEDATTQQQAFNVGADDFISKSKMVLELPNRITNRLKRTLQGPPIIRDS